MEAIQEFVYNMDFENFEKDDKTLSAVIRKFKIIGEATKNIPKNIRKNFPDIPWLEMAAFRDKLIHFYFGLDPKILWDTVKFKLPRIEILDRKSFKFIKWRNFQWISI